MSVLIVDDNPVSARMVEVSLQRNGYETLVVGSGKAALDILSDQLDVQLVILDVMMPDMDGLTLLNRLREHPDLRELPVILCTARTDQDTITKAAFLGCKRIVSKPVRLADLLVKVREETANERPILQDRFRAMSKIGVDFQTYKDVAQAFLSVVDTKLETLAASDRSEETQLDVTDLKEGADLLGAERLNAVVDRIGAPSGIPAGLDLREMQKSMLIRELKLLRAPLQQLLTQV